MFFYMEASTLIVAFSCDVGGGLELLSGVTSLEVLVVVIGFPMVALRTSPRTVLRALSLPQVEEVDFLAEVTLGSSRTHILDLS